MPSRPPTANDLARLYHELGRIGGSSVGRRVPWRFAPRSAEALVALGAALARHDPRLPGILVQLVLARWEAWNPLALRREIRSTDSPQAFAVVAEFAREAGAGDELRAFLDYVCRGLRPIAPAEQFFVGLFSPGSRMARRAEGRMLWAYRRWGFVGWERPVVDGVSKRTVGRLDPTSRRLLLRDLVRRRGRIALGEYLDTVDRAISRQQALGDLRAAGLLRVGHGRGARWHVRPRKHAAARGPRKPPRSAALNARWVRKRRRSRTRPSRSWCRRRIAR